MTQLQATGSKAPRRAPEVEIGSTWFVWGKHQRVTAARNRGGEREVKLIPVGESESKGREFPWVADFRVARHGEPSAFYTQRKEAEAMATAEKAAVRKAQPRRTSKATSGDKVSARGAAVQVLTRARGPLAVGVLTDRVLATKNVNLPGKTPRATVAKAISLECAKPDGVIVRVGTGMYDLRARAGK